MRTKFRRSIVALPMLLTALALPACAKQATGQVAAVVNGDEITLQELNGELGNAKLPDGVDKNKARAAILQRVIEKHLIEQQAKSAGLDRDPEFLLKQRQLTQTLLIQFYAKRAQDTLKVPDPATIGSYVNAHPDNFANRTIFDVDQIRFAPTEKPAVLQGLKASHSLDAIAAVLKENGIPFQRGNAKIDSAQVPEAMIKQVEALPSGEPFVVPTPQGFVASVILSRQAAPLPDTQAQPLAAQMIRSQQLEELMQQRLKDAKAQAKITYQPGYGPPPATPAATPK